MTVLEYLQNNILVLDGGMGTTLHKEGLEAGTRPETWNLTHPEIIKNIHRQYFDSGSNVVATNTFGANSLNFAGPELESIINAAVNIARRAASESSSSKPKFVALDIGPLGKMLKPYGELDFEDAVEVFAGTVRLGVKANVDLIYIETMTDCYETKAALLAAKENSDLPVFVSNAYDESGRLMTGSDPSVMVALLEGMGADAIGVNCSFGPKALLPVVRMYLEKASVPVIFKPNAGMPHVDLCGCTAYDVDEVEYAACMKQMIQEGVRIAGGCCGTTPSYIKELTKSIDGLKPVDIVKKQYSVICSGTKCVDFADTPVLIGERINPTGKKRFKKALLENDITYILKEALGQAERGAHVLDVNVGLPGLDEVSVLPSVVGEIQTVTDLPLQIDTTNVAAMEKSLRLYNGKAIINSVNGKMESMASVFPLARKYGAMVVALTLDEDGIPETAQQRLEVARKILATAETYGLEKKDLLIDPLVLAVSAQSNAAMETLKAVELLHRNGYLTSLGISNVSFGLPQRDILNRTFFTMALSKGLSAAIMNPYSDDMIAAVRAFRVLDGKDTSCSDFIGFAAELETQNSKEQSMKSAKDAKEPRTSVELGDELGKAVLAGMKENAVSTARELLKSEKPMQIIEGHLIPALNAAGVEYENRRMFLPQLLMSAEAASGVFELIRSISSKTQTNGNRVVLATVKGDIHDIGKNIVHMLLENYGFDVIDLGKDVEPQAIVDAVLSSGASLAGLCALMTTTVPAMEKTIELLGSQAPQCRIVVGGAVLTADYASAIGAHFYAKDAMEAVRCAQKVYLGN